MMVPAPAGVSLRRVRREHPLLELRVGHHRHLLGERQRRDLAERGVREQRVQRALEAEQQADRAGSDLPRHRQAIGIGGRQQLELAPVGVTAHLHERERHGPARCLGHSPEDRELLVDIREVRHPLQHALAGRADRARDAEQLAGLRGERRCEVALARTVVQRAGGREAERAGLDPVTSESGHGLDVVRGGGLAAGSALPHHVKPQRSVRDLHGDVDVERPPVEGVHELRERLPVPRETLVEHRTRDVLDALHQLDEPVVIGGMHGREADPAVADDDGRDPVPRRGDHSFCPRGLAVVVRMDVDEAGRDEQSVGVDRALGARVEATDLGDEAAVDRDVGGTRRRARAVDDRAPADDQLVRAHDRTLRSRSAGRTSRVSSCSDARACSGSARKLAPVMTKRVRPSSASPRNRSTHASGGPTTANRSTNSAVSGAVCAATLLRCSLLS